MKMPGKGNLPVAILLMSTSSLMAQDQSFPPADQQFSQAGSVSVDMATGEPIQPPQTTEILAIYRGPGYFDEALLEISSSAASAPATYSPPEQLPPSLPDSSTSEASNPPAPYEQGEALPPPPVLPPPTENEQAVQDQVPAPELPPQSIPEQNQGQSPETIPVPPVDPSLDPAVAPAPASENAPSPQLPMSAPTQEGEPLPPPPMLDALPAFPQGE